MADNRLRKQQSFRADFDLLEDGIAAQIQRVLDEIGDKTLEHLKETYTHDVGPGEPSPGPGFANRTYDLQKSLRARADAVQHRVTLRVSANTFYAGYVETIKDGTYAYLGPALNDMIPVAEDMFRQQLNVETMRSNFARDPRTGRFVRRV